MSDIKQLLENNREWAASRCSKDPDFFSRLARQQTPQYLWIGCSDSRVPANQIIDLDPGEVFVHRNVANLVVHTDLNALSVVQFAVDALKVKHVLVVGHYGCGGVDAALKDQPLGLIDNWLRHIQDVHDRHLDILDRIDDHAEKRDRLCELNVMQQVVNLSHNSVMREAWARGQEVRLHGWCYSINDGLIRDLGMSASNRDEALARFREATDRVRQTVG